MANETKKYASLNTLQTFLNNLKNMFAAKTTVDALSASLDSKANSSALSNYYTKAETNDLELITTDNIDTICGTDIITFTIEGMGMYLAEEGMSWGRWVESVYNTGTYVIDSGAVYTNTNLSITITNGNFPVASTSLIISGEHYTTKDSSYFGQ